jgi:geranylgeranyl reductase family protein
MISEHYHTIVVGAGPGGSAAAAFLAQKGWRVLLIDKATFPRDKVCGDFISPRSLRVLQALGCSHAIERAAPNRLNAASLYLNGEKITAGKIPQVGNLPDYGYTLPRLRFDEIVFRQAQASGVETIEACEVKDLTFSKTGVEVIAQKEGKPYRFNSRLLIGADGAHSTVARILGAPVHNSKNTIIALRAYFDGVRGDSQQADLFFDASYFPGYAWIFPLGNGRANVGLGMAQDVYKNHDINLRQRMLDWIEYDPIARQRLEGARMDGRITGWPLNTYRSSGGNFFERVLLIGDAASFVDPINGEGIHTALESARIAAQVADEALKADDFSSAFLARYEKEWRAAFDLDLRTADFIVTIIKNRSLTGVWLLILKMIGEKALNDPNYAATCGGILAGVIPTSQSLAPSIVIKTLLHGPRFWQRNLNIPLAEGPLGLLNFGLATASKTLDAFSQMASQPRETVGWGVEVAAKAGGVLNGFSQNYSLERMVGVFNEFFQAWLTQIIRSQE